MNKILNTALQAPFIVAAACNLFLMWIGMLQPPDFPTRHLLLFIAACVLAGLVYDHRPLYHHFRH